MVKMKYKKYDDDKIKIRYNNNNLDKIIVQKLFHNNKHKSLYWFTQCRLCLLCNLNL